MKTVLSLTLAACTTIALPTAILLNSTIASSIAQSHQAKLTAYSANKLTFKAPSHWIIYPTKSDNTVILYNQKMPRIGGGSAPTNMIKVYATFSKGDWQSILMPNPRAEQVILKTEKLMIAGKPAIRRYTGPGSAGEFMNTVTTMIRYSGTEIASVSTYYDADNPYAEGFINQIHNSIVLRK